MLDLVIIGAGPCGLSCGIEASRHQLKYLLLDKGNVAEAIRRYPVQMNFFSTSENIQIGDVPLISHDIRPTRFEALKYYQQVAAYFKLPIKRFTEVYKVVPSEEGFEVKSSQGTFKARFVIIATGYYDLPKHLNIAGENLPHVSHYYDEAFKYNGTECLVVGGANSAIETALDLHRNGAKVTLLHQFATLDKNVKYWIRPDAENRIKEGSIQGIFNARITAITPEEAEYKTVEGKQERIKADFVFLMTGYRPDAHFLEECGISLKGEALIPDVDPDNYESNVANLFLAGSIIGGEETAKVFIENGRHHARPILNTIKARL